jgi:hypothetical protein
MSLPVLCPEYTVRESSGTNKETVDGFGCYCVGPLPGTTTPGLLSSTPIHPTRNANPEQKCSAGTTYREVVSRQKLVGCALS